MPQSSKSNRSQSTQATRRGFLASAGAGATLAGAFLVNSAGPLAPQLKAQRATGASGATNPFKDPSFAAGREMRLGEFVGRGADPEAAAAIFNKMTSLDAEPWVAEWTKLAVPFEHQGAELEAQGKMAEANKAYLKAAAYYGIAKFPCINHPA